MSTAITKWNVTSQFSVDDAEKDLTMVRLESIEDERKGVVTYELRDGSRVCIDRRAVSELGAATILRDMGLGHLLSIERVPVMRRGRQIGTVPADFDPAFIKSLSYFYDPRPGDFKRDGDVWIAANNLGGGDLEAIPGFSYTAAQRT